MPNNYTKIISPALAKFVADSKGATTVPELNTLRRVIDKISRVAKAKQGKHDLSVQLAKNYLQTGKKVKYTSQKLTPMQLARNEVRARVFDVRTELRSPEFTN